MISGPFYINPSGQAKTLIVWKLNTADYSACLKKSLNWPPVPCWTNRGSFFKLQTGYPEAGSFLSASEPLNWQVLVFVLEGWGSPLVGSPPVQLPPAPPLWQPWLWGLAWGRLGRNLKKVYTFSNFDFTFSTYWVKMSCQFSNGKAEGAPLLGCANAISFLRFCHDCWWCSGIHLQGYQDQNFSLYNIGTNCVIIVGRFSYLVLS